MHHGGWWYSLPSSVIIPGTRMTPYVDHLLHPFQELLMEWARTGCDAAAYVPLCQELSEADHCSADSDTAAQGGKDQKRAIAHPAR